MGGWNRNYLQTPSNNNRTWGSFHASAPCAARRSCRGRLRQLQKPVGTVFHRRPFRYGRAALRRGRAAKMAAPHGGGPRSVAAADGTAALPWGASPSADAGATGRAPPGLSLITCRASLVERAASPFFPLQRACSALYYEKPTNTFNFSIFQKFRLRWAEAFWYNVNLVARWLVSPWFGTIDFSRGNTGDEFLLARLVVFRIVSRSRR